MVAEISYEDEYGTVSTVEKTFELFVTEPAPDMDMEEMYDPSMMEDGGENGGLLEGLRANLAFVLGGAAAAVLLVVIGIRKYRKHRLEKESRTEDEI